MKIDGYAISTLMIWARNQAPVVRWNEGVNQNTAEAERRLVRLEIAYDEPFQDVLTARVYLAEPRCLIRGERFHALEQGCECGPLADRKVN